jgi:hypothetical protein
LRCFEQRSDPRCSAQAVTHTSQQAAQTGHWDWSRAVTPLSLTTLRATGRTAVLLADLALQVAIPILKLTIEANAQDRPIALAPGTDGFTIVSPHRDVTTGHAGSAGLDLASFPQISAIDLHDTQLTVAPAGDIVHALTHLRDILAGRGGWLLAFVTAPDAHVAIATAFGLALLSGLAAVPDVDLRRGRIAPGGRVVLTIPLDVDVRPRTEVFRVLVRGRGRIGTGILAGPRR